MVFVIGCIPRLKGLLPILKAHHGRESILLHSASFTWDFPGGTAGKESPCLYKRHKRCGFSDWVRKIPWRRKWQPTPVFLPGKFRGQGSLVGYSSWGCKQSDMTEPSTHRVLNEGYPGTSLAGQRLGLSTLTGVAPGSIPGWKIKMPQAVWHGQKKKKMKTLLKNILRSKN